MPRVNGFCWKCGTAWAGDSQPGRSDYCSKCNADLHSCRGCQHHDPNRNNQCRIPGTEEVRDRERSNFCEQYQIRTEAPGGEKSPSEEEKRKRWAEIFGGPRN